MRQEHKLHGVDIGFEVERNINGSKCFPGPDGPAIDVYTCGWCEWEFRGSANGVSWSGGQSPQEEVDAELLKHARLCREFRLTEHG